MQNLETITRLVCQVAREAGSYIRKERAGFSVEKVERKHAHDYVSYVDKGSEQLIVSRLREIVPEAGFITEEGTTRDDVRCQMSDVGCIYPRLNEGGVLIIHDYNNTRFKGIRQAVKEYERKLVEFGEKPLKLVPLGDLHGSCVIIK